MQPPVTRIVYLLLALGAQAQAGAIVEGIVRLPEAPPTPAPKPRYAVTASYVVGEPDAPAAVVFLDGAGAAIGPTSRAVMAQEHYQFAPGVLAIRRGTRVEFPNLDDEYHSVFSYSRPKRFDLGRYQKDEKPAAIQFDEAGIVKLFCEIHDHMRGTIVVVDTPHFAKTDPTGRFRLTDLPAGQFVLKAWVGEETVRERPVTLRDGATLQVDFPEG
jgi:plastocyanin